MKQTALVVGGGGHARVVVDALLRSGRYEQVVLTDSDPALHGTRLEGMPIVGDESRWPELRASGILDAVVGIGSNEVRGTLTDRLRAAGFRLLNAIHPASVVAPTVHLGGGIVIMAGAIVNPNTSIGDAVIVNTAASIDHDCVIERDAHLGPGSHLGGSVHVGRSAFVGLGASVIPGVSIGAGAIVGAGAAVVSNVPPHTVVVGVPARPMRPRR